MDPENLEWYYVDRSGSEFGPFASSKMHAWFTHDFFPIAGDLLVRLDEWKSHVPVKVLYPDLDSAFCGRPRIPAEHQRPEPPPGQHHGHHQGAAAPQHEPPRDYAADTYDRRHAGRA